MANSQRQSTFSKELSDKIHYVFFITRQMTPNLQEQSVYQASINGNMHSF